MTYGLPVGVTAADVISVSGSADNSKVVSSENKSSISTIYIIIYK